MSNKAERQKTPRITYALDRHGKPKGKRVDSLKSFSTPVLSDRQAQDLATILSCIQNGLELDDRYYRRGLGATTDTLLAKHGVMHLHLGGQGSNCILYLIQYSDHVLLIEVSGHGYLDSVPEGKGLPYGEIQESEKRVQADADTKAAQLTASREKLLSGKKRKPDPTE